jgi:hypothetical protein
MPQPADMHTNADFTSLNTLLLEIRHAYTAAVEEGMSDEAAHDQAMGVTLAHRPDYTPEQANKVIAFAMHSRNTQ